MIYGNLQSVLKKTQTIINSKLTNVIINNKVTIQAYSKAGQCKKL